MHSLYPTSQQPDIQGQERSFSMASYDLDDAFSEGEDVMQESFTLSRDAVREELNKSLQTSWPESDHGGPMSTDVSRVHDNSDTSASTGSSGWEEHLPSDLSQELPSQFVQISLSDPDPASLENTHPPSERSVEHEPDLHEQEAEPYPHVIIDVSKPAGNRVSITSDSPSLSTNASSAPPTPPPISRSLPTTSLNSPAAGASSASLKTTLSQPTPEIPQSSDLPSSDLPSTSAPSMPPIAISAPQFPKVNGHRPTRSTGPSMFEKVRSKTRPSFLPPKPREEDDKHMAYWQSMMKQSRAAAEKRRKALQDRRLARERKIEESLGIWERDIVPDWRIVRSNHTLRKLWWKGIPTKLRASMWEKAVGNTLALSKENYRSYLARATRALSSGVFPSEVLEQIDADIASTLPSLHIFHRDIGPMFNDLRDMLCAWTVSRSDEGLGYVPGASRVAAMFLLNMPAQQAFVVMRNLLERHCMRSFFGGENTKDDVEAYYRIFDTLLADCMPKIYFNFKQHQISPAAYLPDWLIPLFLDHLPFEACARLWDVLLLEGDSFLYQAALGILAVLEPRLFFPDRKELLELLKGENKAALEVARRDGQPLNGGKYEIYGVDEESLWERIDSMEEWWKESTWTRLIQRELPDI